MAAKQRLGVAMALYAMWIIPIGQHFKIDALVFYMVSAAVFSVGALFITQKQ